MVGSRDRYPALKRLADANPNIFAVVFCRTKRDTQKVAEKLIEDGYNAGSLHGDLSQNQRDLVMKSFRNKQIQMLVATDVAARGIDVEDITHVINYQLPDEIETYTHRSGRTGRAGKTGLSIVIITKSEQRRIKTIEKMIQKQFVKKEIPEGILICEIQLKALAHKINDTEINGEIDNYLEEIKTLFSNTTKDELIKKFFSVEFSRFFNYYNKAKNLNVPKGDTHFSQSDNSDNSARFFINIGKKDGYDWMQMKDFLRDSLGLSQGDVFKVDVKDSFSFFNTEISHMPKVLEFFNDFKLNGRYINVEITEKKDRSRQRRRGKQKHDGYGNRGKSGRGRSTRSSDFKHGTGSSRPRRNRRR
jgi:ATP-dependent RNA helicase DeaD